MEYEKIILECLSRIKELEEKVEQLSNELEELKSSKPVKKFDKKSTFLFEEKFDQYKQIINALAHKERLQTNITFEFNGNLYSRSELVFAVVKDYVDNNDITYDEIQKVFSVELQGKLPVILDSNQVTFLHLEDSYNQDNVLSINDAFICVCTKWGSLNILRFIDNARDNLGYQIKIVK